MKIFFLGSSGLVGSTVYSELLLQENAPELISFSRRRLHLMGGVEKVSDLSNLKKEMEGLTADKAFSGVGTTIKKAKSREAFEEADLNLPLRFAVAAKEQGVKDFHLISSLGANAASKNLYLRTKGLLERELSQIGFESLTIYRPSLLLGDRSEFRLGEELLTAGYRSLQFLYPKALNTYRPIEVTKLSHFIVRKILGNSSGVRIYENAEMLNG